MSIKEITMQLLGEELSEEAAKWLEKRYTPKEWQDELYRLLMLPDYVLEAKMNYIKNRTLK